MRLYIQRKEAWSNKFVCLVDVVVICGNDHEYETLFVDIISLASDKITREGFGICKGLQVTTVVVTPSALYISEHLWRPSVFLFVVLVILRQDVGQ